MSNVVPLLRNPPPSEEVATGFGRELFDAHIDPSDDEACFFFLYAKRPDQLMAVISNAKAAIEAAGQLYIAAQVSEAG